MKSCHLAPIQGQSRRPREGAWIEMIREMKYSQVLRVAPARGRGLKFCTAELGHGLGGVAPARGRGLKLGALRNVSVTLRVAPARGRGLK